MTDAELRATVAAVWGWARDAASAFHGVGWDSSMAGGITYSEGFDSVLALCDAVERLTQERDAARDALAGLLNATTENVGFQATVRAVAKANNALAQLDAPAPPRGEEE